MWRFGLFVFILAASVSAQDLTEEWYPHQPGTNWVYQKESLEGDIRHPDYERWTTEETVVSAVSDAKLGGVVVTKRVTVTNDKLSANYSPLNDEAKKEPGEKRELIWHNCVYPFDGVLGSDVAGGKVPADFCFPMSQGSTWGRLADTSPAEEFVWRVKGMNADPFGVPGGITFHLWDREGSGTIGDEWFAKGIGLLQYVSLHHGTYEEWRAILLKATIAGKTRTLDLKPARLTPVNEYDCEGSVWRYFAHTDGTDFRSHADCVQYAKSRSPQ